MAAKWSSHSGESGAITNSPDRLRSMPMLALGHLVHQFLIEWTWSLESRTPRFVKGAFPTFRDWCPRPQAHLPRASGQHRGTIHQPNPTYSKAAWYGDTVAVPRHFSPLVQGGVAQTSHTSVSITSCSNIIDLAVAPEILDRNMRLIFGGLRVRSPLRLNGGGVRLRHPAGYVGRRRGTNDDNVLSSSGSGFGWGHS